VNNVNSSFLKQNYLPDMIPFLHLDL